MTPTPTAIDFRKLLQQEKKKARQERQQQQQQQQGFTEASEESSESVNIIQKSPRCNKQNQSPTSSSSSSLPQLPPWHFTSTSNSNDNEEDESAAAAAAVSIQNLKTICQDPPLLRYQEHFLPYDYRRALTAWLQALPSIPYDPHQKTLPNNKNGNCIGWTTLPHAQRRVVVLTANSSTRTSSTCLGFPQPLQPLVEAVAPLFPSQYPPNHILINSYPNTTKQGIMPHTDGPAYINLTCTISMGADVILQFTTTTANTCKTTTTAALDDRPTTHHNHPPPLLKVFLSGQGSLVVFSQDLYSNYLHSIDPSSSSTTTTLPATNNDNYSSDCIIATETPSSLSSSSNLPLPSPHEQQHQQQVDRISITIRHKYC